MLKIVSHCNSRVAVGRGRLKNVCVLFPSVTEVSPCETDFVVMNHTTHSESANEIQQKERCCIEGCLPPTSPLQCRMVKISRGLLGFILPCVLEDTRSNEVKVKHTSCADLIQQTSAPLTRFPTEGAFLQLFDL